MDVDWVFFDAGHTLIHPEPPVGQVYAAALQRHGLQRDPGDVERRFNEAWQDVREKIEPGRLPYGNSDAEARSWWRRVVKRSCQLWGASEVLEEVFEDLWEHFASPGAWSLYEDALPTIEKLRARDIGLGLISNWDSRLVHVLEGLDLWQLLEVRIVSFDVGAEKPDPRIFRRALTQADVSAERALHVGNAYEEDVLGALRAGMQALWLRRDDAEAPAAPVRTIRTLAQIPPMLR